MNRTIENRQGQTRGTRRKGRGEREREEEERERGERKKKGTMVCVTHLSEEGKS
jgi:hypothetical protein